VVGFSAMNDKIAPELYGASLISDALPFGRLWYGEPNAVINAIDYTKFYSSSPR
jgi:hypothetical protein